MQLAGLQGTSVCREGALRMGGLLMCGCLMHRAGRRGVHSLILRCCHGIGKGLKLDAV